MEHKPLLVLIINKKVHQLVIKLFSIIREASQVASFNLWHRLSLNT